MKYKIINGKMVVYTGETIGADLEIIDIIDYKTAKRRVDSVEKLKRYSAAS